MDVMKNPRATMNEIWDKLQKYRNDTAYQLALSSDRIPENPNLDEDDMSDEDWLMNKDIGEIFNRAREIRNIINSHKIDCAPIRDGGFKVIREKLDGINAYAKYRLSNDTEENLEHNKFRLLADSRPSLLVVSISHTNNPWKDSCTIRENCEFNAYYKPEDFDAIGAVSDPNRVYGKQKCKACIACGFDFAYISVKVNNFTEENKYDDYRTIEEVIAGCINSWIKDFYDGHGFTSIIIQRPIPEDLDFIVDGIDYYLKGYERWADVDGLSDENEVFLNHPKRANNYDDNYWFKPCTPEGIMNLLTLTRRYAKYINTYNETAEVKADLNKYCDLFSKYRNAKQISVVGRSDIVGMPMFKLLVADNKTVTLLHSKTSKNTFHKVLKESDIIITCAGVKNLITADDMDQRPVVIDVSINRDDDGTLCGDMSKDAYEKVSFYTPVPGGVGPLTVLTLMEHVYYSWLRKQGIYTLNYDLESIAFTKADDKMKEL